MSDKIQSPQDVAKSGANATYSDDDESVSTLDYFRDQKPLRKVLRPYCPFPSVMNAYGGMKHGSGKKIFALCGANKDEPLYAVTIHFGYSGRTPLGTRPGLILHNGTSKKDPVLAAVGFESQLAARVYSLSLNTVILLPGPSNVVTEIMRATVTDDGKAAFLFSIEVASSESSRREKFEWRKFKKGEEEDSEAGGFRLVQTAFRGSEKPGSFAELETLALVKWTKGWAKIPHPFSLNLIGRAQSTEFGERWRLMVVMTALGLYYRRGGGMNKKGFISAAEKIRGKK